jgi:hypothetical protein
MGLTGCPETSVATNLLYVTSQTSEDITLQFELFFSAVERNNFLMSVMCNIIMNF